jgi:Icc-related predicted phosphoesterase
MGNHGSRGGSKEFPEGAENIDGRVVEYKGVLIAGLEGSMRYNDRPLYQYTEAAMQRKIAALTPALLKNKLQHGRYLDILITHAPPYSIHDGKDLAHRGFESFLWFIDHYRPDYLIHGHQHVYDNRTVTETLRGYKILEFTPSKVYSRRNAVKLEAAPKK